MRYGWVRRSDHTVEFAVVEPVVGAVFAGVDYDVPRPAVRVRVHGRAALWAMDAAVQIFPIGRVRGVDRNLPAGAQVFHDFGEYAHGDQHAAATFAIKNAFPGNGGVRERYGAERTEDGGGHA